MKLPEPITIEGLAFKNRVMFPPLTTGYEAQDGSICSQSRAFYTRLAQGGVGHIVLGDVSPVASFTPTPKLFHDSQIDSFRQLADSVHAHGAKLGVQIFHPEYDGAALSALFRKGEMEQVRARLHHDMKFFADNVTETALLKIIEAMRACAMRAQTAGMDVIQVHGDRLVGALCSSQMNHRTDLFGGSLENRTRFALLLVRALKKAVPNMVIDYKFPVVMAERGKVALMKPMRRSLPNGCKTLAWTCCTWRKPTTPATWPTPSRRSGFSPMASLWTSRARSNGPFPSRSARWCASSTPPWPRASCKAAKPTWWALAARCWPTTTG